MKITILCENETSIKCWDKEIFSEWGFSAFLETKNANILFDTGKSDMYWNNSKNLGIDLNKTDFIVLSHYHLDHAKGLMFHDFKNIKKLIIHPHIIEKVPKNDAEKIKKDFEIITTEKSLEISPSVYYLGQIPRKTDFEKGTCEGEEMFDDSALAIKSNKGVIVLTGCSHSGICNICEHAKEVTGQKLYSVIGGFHLFEDEPEVVNKTIEYFKAENPEELYPTHCTDFPVLSKFHSLFGIRKISTGDVLKYDD
jgi:7,8-dihydropterin-6-yl-methyl-4-(beta-D-ribofuranosyl)aminobenzene 5'-phosphate synthase